MYVERTTVAIGVQLLTYQMTGLLIASVSYNGIKLATTGDSVSRWKYSRRATDWRSTWWTPEYNETYWKVADTSGVCDFDSAPSTTWEGSSYSEFISANGVTPASYSPQYGGNISRWIGLNEFNGDCSGGGVGYVMFRAKINLMELAEEPTCYSEHDGRSFLSPDTPIVHFPNIGLKSITSRVLSFIGSAEASIEVWVDGIGAIGSRGMSRRRSTLLACS